MQPTLTLYGDKALMRALNALPVRVQKRVARSAALAAMRPVATAGKQGERTRRKETREGEQREEKRRRITEGSYHLYETYGVVARGPYPASGTIVAVAGPRVGEKGNRGKLGHLIESGHEKVLWGRRTGGRVRGFHVLKRAWDQSVSQVQHILRQKLGAGIEREAAKLRR